MDDTSTSDAAAAAPLVLALSGPALSALRRTSAATGQPVEHVALEAMAWYSYLRAAVLEGGQLQLHPVDRPAVIVDLGPLDEPATHA